MLEGCPDKICDLIADSVLDACLQQDKHSRVACEVVCKNHMIMVFGEITTQAKVDYEQIVRSCLTEVGMTNSNDALHINGKTVNIIIAIEVRTLQAHSCDCCD
jgi:S-adenosylmethionine synthetase